MADTRQWIKLDVGYMANPKIAELIEDHPYAVFLHLQCILYSKQHHTDGIAPMRIALRNACASQCDLEKCIEYGLLEQINPTHLLVHDYVEHQGSAAEAKNRSDKAKQSAKARWDDANRNAKRNASSNTERNANRNAEKRREEKNKNTPSTGVDDAFDEFWQAYPKKVDKGHARKAFAAALKKASKETIIDGANRFAETSKNAERRFVPHAATWLNGDRWADETPTEPELESWERSWFSS